MAEHEFIIGFLITYPKSSQWKFSNSSSGESVHVQLPLCIKCFFSNHTKKVIGTIIVELDESKHLFTIYYGRKFGKNCSKLGSNCQILIILQNKCFLDMEIFIFFSDVNFYSMNMINPLIPPNR